MYTQKNTFVEQRAFLLIEIATALVNPKAHASMTKQHSEQLRCLEDDDDVSCLFLEYYSD